VRYDAVMIEVIWTYRVREEHLAEFDRFYHSGGVWAEFFHGAPEYRGTVLLRDGDDRLRFVTIDRWDSRGAYERFLRDHDSGYRQLDAACADFTTEETRIGCFEVC
jgi:Antibiotic biosynthesis monooxygenase